MGEEPEALLGRLGALRVLAGQHRIALSPDGRRVAYAVRAAHGEPEPHNSFYSTGAPGLARGCALQVTDLESGETTLPLPAERGRSWRPSWSPDGRSLAFYADAGGAVHAVVWRPDSGVAALYPVATVRCRAFATDRPRWSPDGRFLYMPVCPPGLERAFAGEDAVPASGPVVLSSTGTGSAAASAAALRARWGADVGRLDLADGTLRRLTSGLPVAEPHLSPDGRWLAFYTLARADADGGPDRCELYVLPAVGGEAMPIAAGLKGSSHGRHRPAWHPAGGALAFLRDGRPFVCTPDAGAAQPAGDLPEAADDRYLAWTPDGEGLLLRGHSGTLWRVGAGPRAGRATALHLPGNLRIARPLQPEASDAATALAGALLVPAQGTADGRARLLRVPLVGGQAEVLWVEDALLRAQPFSNTWHWFGDATADGCALVYSRETPAAPTDLWARTPADGAQRRLTDLNPGLHTEVRCARPTFRLSGGQEARGLLWLPRDGAPPFPTVAVLAPDLEPAAEPHRFEPEAAAGFAPHYLVARGLAVWMPDLTWPGGETERGERVAWDALASVDALVAQGHADPARLAVAGYGLGAYAVHALMVRSDRFRAAVSTAGIANFSAMHGELGVWQGEPDLFAATQCEGLLGVDGGPWADPWRYVRESPLFALHRVRTPLLLITGRQPAPQSEALFVGLCRLGLKAVLLRYPQEEGDAPFHWRAAAFQDVVRRMADWLCGV